MHTPFVRGSGGMVSTAADYARFCQMYLGRGQFQETQFLPAASVQQGTSPQTRSLYTAEQLKTRSHFYGFGWRVHRDGSFSHSGSEGTFAWVDPRLKIIGLVFTQSPGGKNPRDEFRQLVGQACSPLAGYSARRPLRRIIRSTLPGTGRRQQVAD